jgi:alpha-ketoglutarate-dependent taurine dioxygenase
MQAATSLDGLASPSKRSRSTGPLDDPTFAAIERAYNEYGVIFFRGQSITPQQVAHCPPR